MVLRIILGAVYVAMAAGQLASWPHMAAVMGGYDVAPAVALPLLAAGLIVGELVCGVWFLARLRSQALAGSAPR